MNKKTVHIRALIEQKKKGKENGKQRYHCRDCSRKFRSKSRPGFLRERNCGRSSAGAVIPLVNYHADITDSLTGYEKNCEHMSFQVLS